MTAQTKTTNKSNFETGDVPTQAQFVDLIDSYQDFDADTLKADTADVLTAGFAQTVYDIGTVSTVTTTPNEANGNMQKFANNGAHTFAPPSNSCSLVVLCTNAGSAGAITTSGFTKVTGSTLTTTNTEKFLFYVTKLDTVSHLAVVALQ
jgi:hypothetical protein